MKNEKNVGGECGRSFFIFFMKNEKMKKYPCEYTVPLGHYGFMSQMRCNLQQKLYRV